jgi:mRNA-degrading endonuclease RelE of RelBE toxin-antitoxin system
MTEPTAFSIERIAPSAEGYLRRLPRHRQEAVGQAFDHLCNVSPFRHPNPTVIRPLKGKRKGQWRYRIGDIRIVYTVDRERHTIRIVSIDSRGNVY